MFIQDPNFLFDTAALKDSLNGYIKKKQFPQSSIFIGPLELNLKFVLSAIATLICQEPLPCGQCHACKLYKAKNFPDLQIIAPDDGDTIIKIDQIRTLQQTAFQSPKVGTLRFIIIMPAEAMNLASANSLLKILEEPPLHTSIILLTESINRLLPTVRSRCQQFVLPFSKKSLHTTGGAYNLYQSGYPMTPEKFSLFERAEALLVTFSEVIQGKIVPSTAVLEWKDYALKDLLWFLYLITAQIIHYKITRKKLASNSDVWENLSSCLKLTTWFKGLEAINALQKKINHNINVNPTLALERLLIGYINYE